MTPATKKTEINTEGILLTTFFLLFPFIIPLFHYIDLPSPPPNFDELTRIEGVITKHQTSTYGGRPIKTSYYLTLLTNNGEKYISLNNEQNNYSLKYIIGNNVTIFMDKKSNAWQIQSNESIYLDYEIKKQNNISHKYHGMINVFQIIKLQISLIILFLLINIKKLKRYAYYNIHNKTVNRDKKYIIFTRDIYITGEMLLMIAMILSWIIKELSYALLFFQFFLWKEKDLLKKIISITNKKLIISPNGRGNIIIPFNIIKQIDFENGKGYFNLLICYKNLSQDLVENTTDEWINPTRINLINYMHPDKIKETIYYKFNRFCKENSLSSST